MSIPQFIKREVYFGRGKSPIYNFMQKIDPGQTSSNAKSEKRQRASFCTDSVAVKK